MNDCTMGIGKHYQIFLMDTKYVDGPMVDIAYAAEGPGNGEADRSFKMDHPLVAREERGGLVLLSEMILNAQLQYLRSSVHKTIRPKTPCLSFSFNPPYEFVMWNESVWQTKELSAEEKVKFVDEMQKQYASYERDSRRISHIPD